LARERRKEKKKAEEIEMETAEIKMKMLERKGNDIQEYETEEEEVSEGR